MVWVSHNHQRPKSLIVRPLLYKLNCAPSLAPTFCILAGGKEDKQKAIPSALKETLTKLHASFLPTSRWPELSDIVTSSSRKARKRIFILTERLFSKEFQQRMSKENNLCWDFAILKFPRELHIVDIRGKC